MNTEWRGRFSSLARRTAPPEISWLMARALEVPGLVSLAAGFVDQVSLPHRDVSRELEALLSCAENGPAALQYGTTQGDLALRTLLTERLRREGVFHPQSNVEPSHMLIGSGSQQILYLLSEALLDEGDIVLVEAPTYFVVLGGFRSRGARTVGLDIDEHGLRPEAMRDCLARLEAQGELSRVKMLYAMTYAGNPHGITLAAERRRELLALLREYREKGYPILLVEDAAYRRLCFGEAVPAPVMREDEAGDLVLYTESFSKSFSPGFRLGFGVGPKALIDKMVDIKGNHDFGSSNFCQQTLRRVLESGLFDEHGARLKQVYSAKCATVQNLLRETLPPEARWLAPDGGFYTWVMLPSGWDTGPESPVFRRALEEKVLYVPGALCYSPDRDESRRSSCLRLAFGMIGEEALREGCDRLGRALNSLAMVS